MPANLTFAQAVETLKSEQEKMAHADHPAQAAEAQKTPQ
jgi:hypothetical protein